MQNAVPLRPNTLWALTSLRPQCNVESMRFRKGRTTMKEKILQINFKFNVPRNQYEEAASLLANDVAATPGCRWKIWLMNDAKHESGGIYLFDDESTLQAFLAGELFAGVGKHP